MRSNPTDLVGFSLKSASFASDALLARGMLRLILFTLSYLPHCTLALYVSPAGRGQNNKRLQVGYRGAGVPICDQAVCPTPSVMSRQTTGI